MRGCLGPALPSLRFQQFGATHAPYSYKIWCYAIDMVTAPWAHLWGQGAVGIRHRTEGRPPRVALAGNLIDMNL